MVVLVLCGGSRSTLRAAGGIRVRTQVSHEVVPIDVDFWSEILVEVRSVNDDRPLRGVVFDFSCSTPDGRLATKAQRGAEREKLRLKTNVRGRIRLYYRYASAEWNGEALKRPRAERVRVKAAQYDFDDKLVIQIGMNFAIRSFALLHGGLHHMQCPEPVLLAIHDVWHPSLDLLPYRALWKDLRLEPRPVKGLPDPPSAPALGGAVARWIEASPDPLEEVWAMDGLEEPDMVGGGGKGGGGLLLPKGGGGEKELRLPCIVWRRPGAAHVKLALCGVVGDTIPEDNEAELRWVCQPLVKSMGKKEMGPALPFDRSLRYFFHQARGRVAAGRAGLARSLGAEDFISFGRHLGGFFRVQARRLTKRGGTLDPGRATGVLMTTVLANALETYLALNEKEKQDVLRASKSFGIREEGFPVVDWIDPVVFGYLHERPTDMVVLLVRAAEGSRPPMERLELFDGDRPVLAMGDEGPVPGRQVLATDRFAVVCLPSPKTRLSVGLDAEGVLVQTSQLLDAETFLTRRSVLTGQAGRKARFPVGADPRAKIEILDGAGKVETSFEAKVAVSDRRPPRILKQQPDEGRRLPVAGGEIEVAWSVGRVGLAKRGGTKLFVDDKLVDAASDGKGRSFHKAEKLEAGFHGWRFDLEDAVGMGDHRRSYFYVERPAGENERVSPWIQAAPTKLAMVTETVVPTRRPTPRPRPVTKKPRPTRPPPVVQETPVVDDDLPVDVGGDEPTPSAEPPATFVPTPAATVTPAPPDPTRTVATTPTPTPTPSGQIMSDEEAANLYSYAATPTPAAPSPSPEPPPTTVVLRDGEIPLKVLEAQLCHYVRNNEAVMPGTSFKRVTPRVTCWIRFENRSEGAGLRVRWSFLRGQTWMKVHEKELALPEGTGIAQTALKVSKGGLFPEGRYRCEIFGTLGLCWEQQFGVVGLTE